MGLRSIISEMPAKELRLHLKSLTDQQNGWLQDGSALLLFCSGQEHNANHTRLDSKAESKDNCGEFSHQFL